MYKTITARSIHELDKLINEEVKKENELIGPMVPVVIATKHDNSPKGAYAEIVSSVQYTQRIYDHSVYVEEEEIDSEIGMYDLDGDLGHIEDMKTEQHRKPSPRKIAEDLIIQEIKDFRQVDIMVGLQIGGALIDLPSFTRIPKDTKLEPKTTDPYHIGDVGSIHVWVDPKVSWPDVSVRNSHGLVLGELDREALKKLL